MLVSRRPDRKSLSHDTSSFVPAATDDNDHTKTSALEEISLNLWFTPSDLVEVRRRPFTFHNL